MKWLLPILCLLLAGCAGSHVKPKLYSADDERGMGSYGVLITVQWGGGKPIKESELWPTERTPK